MKQSIFAMFRYFFSESLWDFLFFEKIDSLSNLLQRTDHLPTKFDVYQKKVIIIYISKTIEEINRKL